MDRRNGVTPAVVWRELKRTASARLGTGAATGTGPPLEAARPSAPLLSYPGNCIPAQLMLSPPARDAPAPCISMSSVVLFVTLVRKKSNNCFVNLHVHDAYHVGNKVHNTGRTQHLSWCDGLPFLGASCPRWCDERKRAYGTEAGTQLGAASV